MSGSFKKGLWIVSAVRKYHLGPMTSESVSSFCRRLWKKKRKGIFLLSRGIHFKHQIVFQSFFFFFAMNFPDTKHDYLRQTFARSWYQRTAKYSTLGSTEVTRQAAQRTSNTVSVLSYMSVHNCC